MKSHEQWPTIMHRQVPDKLSDQRPPGSDLAGSLGAEQVDGGTSGRVPRDWQEALLPRGKIRPLRWLPAGRGPTARNKKGDGEERQKRNNIESVE